MNLIIKAPVFLSVINFTPCFNSCKSYSAMKSEIDKLLALTALQSGGFCVVNARSSEVCVIVLAEHWQLLHFMHLRTSLTPGCHFVDELLNILFWRKYVRSRTQIFNFFPAVIYKVLGSHNFVSLCVGP